MLNSCRVLHQPAEEQLVQQSESPPHPGLVKAITGT